jgi:hypothetical protein
MKSPKKKKAVKRPDHPEAKSFMEVQAQMETVQALLLKFFDGAGSKADETRMDESLKSIGSLLGFSKTAVEDDPQQLQLGLLRAFKTISQVSKNALQSAKPLANPETEKLFAMIRDFEAELAKQDAQLAQLAQEVEAQAALKQASHEPTEVEAEGKERLEAIQAGMEKLLADQSIGFEGIFTGMERVMEQFADRLGIPKPKERDIVAEVSAQVSKDLAEANKKNMIGEDFDWSSIWRKS